jgi:formyltetrahydrofolate deformylase
MTTDLTEITVIGADDAGLIARVTSLLFERGINIEDLDQAVREGLFRMTMHVDTSEMVCRNETLREDLLELGEELGVDVQVRVPSERDTQRIAVLVTRESHCLEVLLDAAETDALEAEISVVIGNHNDLQPLAERHDVPFHDVGDDGGQPDEDTLLDLLSEYEIDLLVLARYMRILSPNVVFRYENRIINIHPSLLPAFPGARAYEQAIQEGVRIAGVTAHYVTTDLDQGPIITQRAFTVPDGADADELKRRGQPLEAESLLEAVQLHLDGALSVHRGRTQLREGVEETAYQLGLSSTTREASPDGPVDSGLVLDETDVRDREAPSQQPQGDDSADVDAGVDAG